MNYKAWDKTFERMVQTNELCYVTNEGVFRLRPDMKENLYEPLPLERFDIIRPTGLKDKHGKEIYEGDIVQCESGYQKYTTVVRIGEYYQDGSGNEYPSIKCYGVYGEETKDSHGRYVQSSSINENELIEVLGNEYEHPHLLEGVK